MALRHAVVGMLVMAAAMLAVAEAAEMTTDCSNLILQMVDCLPYVTNSTVEKPDGNCCSGLKTVLKTKAECLCEAFSSSSQLGITVNVSKAVTLPSACHVHAPSTSKCGISVSPATAPALSPTGAPFSIANPPSIGGVVPAASPTQKGSSSTTRIPVGLILALIVGAIFSSF